MLSSQSVYGEATQYGVNAEHGYTFNSGSSSQEGDIRELSGDTDKGGGARYVGGVSSKSESLGPGWPVLVANVL